ncbi:MAG: hypothetical protein V4643_04635 [Bacteroidota bacterium]
MKKPININYKTTFISIGLFIVGGVSTFLFEEYYRQLVRFSFNYFNGDNIRFIGKNFHLFPSNSFIIAFGLFGSLAFLLLKFSNTTRSIIQKCFFSILFFFITSICITALDSKRIIVECTACDDGIVPLQYNEITYSKYFIISLSITLIYLLITFFIERRQLKK